MSNDERNFLKKEKTGSEILLLILSGMMILFGLITFMMYFIPFGKVAGRSIGNYFDFSGSYYSVESLPGFTVPFIFTILLLALGLMTFALTLATIIGKVNKEELPDKNRIKTINMCAFLVSAIAYVGYLIFGMAVNAKLSEYQISNCTIISTFMILGPIMLVVTAGLFVLYEITNAKSNKTEESAEGNKKVKTKKLIFTSIVASLLVLAIILGIVLTSAVDPFSVKGAKRINIGDSEQRVLELYNEPEYIEDNVYYYVSNSQMKKLYKKISEKAIEAEKATTIEQELAILEEMTKLLQELEELTKKPYKILAVGFDAEKKVNLVGFTNVTADKKEEKAPEIKNYCIYNKYVRADSALYTSKVFSGYVKIEYKNGDYICKNIMGTIGDLTESWTAKVSCKDGENVYSSYVYVI